MIKDRYGVVHDKKRNRFEKKFHMPYGYEFASFNYREAENICKEKGEGYVVDKVTNDYGAGVRREVIYRV